MIVQRFYDTQLAQASYLIGCSHTQSAVIIDPNRDVEQYIAAASAQGVAITHVTETHIHADFVSGARELADRTGATLYLSDEGGDDWTYAYAAEARAVLVKDGDRFTVGDVRIDVVHTPGHTPEHISFLVTDTVAADAPIAIITGDVVFVGDVGRPDLLEKAAKVTGTMEQAARVLFRSLQRFKAYPDWLQIWPGHGAGSACGKGLSAVPHSTVGYERRFNWAFGMTAEEEFVHAVLSGQPEPPRYFAEMKRLNKIGPRLRHGLVHPERLPASRLNTLLESSALLVDTRPAADYAAAYVPGTLNIPLNGSFTTWAGWLLPYDRDIYLIVDDQCTECVDDAVRDLTMIGLDRMMGYLGSEALAIRAADGHTVSSIPQITTAALAAHLQRGDVTVLDVRGRTEWESGHMPGVENIPLGYLTDRLGDIPRDKPVAVHCQGGARSSIAVSLLCAHGVHDVINVTGGFAAWRQAGYAVEHVASPRDLVQTT